MPRDAPVQFSDEATAERYAFDWSGDGVSYAVVYDGRDRLVHNRYLVLPTADARSLARRKGFEFVMKGPKYLSATAYDRGDYRRRTAHRAAPHRHAHLRR